MKKSTLLLTVIIAAGLTATCYAPRGGHGGGRGGGRSFAARGGGGRSFAARGGGGRGFAARGGFIAGGRGGRGGFIAGGRGVRGGFIAGGRGGRGGFVIAGGRGFGGRGWGHRGWGHRGWGHRGWGHRGWGWGWRRPWGWRSGWGWNYPYYDGGYWGTGVTLATGYSRCIDNAGESFWEITNNTDSEIHVSGGGPRATVAPGSTITLEHPRCILRVDTSYGSEAFSARDHFISVEIDSSGELQAITR